MSSFVVGRLVIGWFVYWLIMVVWLVDHNSSWLMSHNIWVFTFAVNFTWSVIYWLWRWCWLDDNMIVLSVAELRFRVRTRIVAILREISFR